jgi:electron transport complex protein RnfB
LLGVNEKPLNPKFGTEQPRKVAVIIEEDCIGCTKCLPPCPVDAILGANKFMHTVIASECTGCELCIAPCPVDCIVMESIASPSPWDDNAANKAKLRYQNKQLRLQKHAQEKTDRLKKQKEMLTRLRGFDEKKLPIIITTYVINLV